MGALVGLCDVGPDSDPTRVRVLDDCDGGLVALVVGRPDGRVGVDIVVVGHRLAVQLLGPRQTRGVSE